MEALDVGDAEFADGIEDGGVADELGDRADAQAVGHRHDGGNDKLVGTVGQNVRLSPRSRPSQPCLSKLRGGLAIFADVSSACLCGTCVLNRARAPVEKYRKPNSSR